jgi:hypothetical protein
MQAPEITTDGIRALAIQMLDQARTFQPFVHKQDARQAVIRAYNEGCTSFEDPDRDELHPATDMWVLAMNVALGALYEPLAMGDAHGEALELAIADLKMMVAAPKLAAV